MLPDSGCASEKSCCVAQSVNVAIVAEVAVPRKKATGSLVIAAMTFWPSLSHDAPSWLFPQISLQLPM
jgi:hypothetical protein